MSPPDFFIYNKNSNIKEQLLTKIGLPVDTKCETIEDISKIQQAFGKTVPYDNSDLVLNNINRFDEEYIIKRILVDSIGGTCLHQTILQGLLFQEYGFDVQLTRAISSKVSLSELVQFHYTNIVKVNGKRYLVDSSMGVFNSYVPVELGSDVEAPVSEFLTTSYRARKVDDENQIEGFTTYSFEQKRIMETEYTTTFQFIDRPAELSTIEQSQWEYKAHPHCNLLLFIMMKDGGHYMIMKNTMTTVTNFAAPSYRPISDNQDYKEILSTHLNYNHSLNDIDFFSFEIEKSKQQPQQQQQ